MANQNTITVQLTVKDDGSVVMQQFGKNSEDALGKTATAAPKATSALDSLKSSYIEMAAKAATAYMAISKAMEYMDLGAKALQAEASFRTLATASGESADQIIANMMRATNKTIDDSQLMQKASKAMILDFSGDQITQMSEMARLAARTSGENVGEVFDNIVNSISTNMPRSLKQYGLITKEQMAIVNQAMAEGVTDINLYSMATDNFAVQSAKIGPLLENEAEKMQQYRANVHETKESFGKLLMASEGWYIQAAKTTFAPIMATAASISQFSTAPIEAYIDELMKSEDETKKLAATNLTAALAKKAQDDANMKAALGAVAQKKADLETMKALDKDYFTAQESNIKAMEEIKKAAGEDDYKIASDSLKKREADNAEYYTLTKAEIDLEEKSRIKTDRDKVDRDTYIAQKTQVLDKETTNKKIALMQQERQLSVQTAQNDIKNLTSRLGEYQTYYDSLKAKMDKNIEDEKKHLDAIKELRQKQVSYEKTAADTLAMMQGTDKNLTSQQKYETSRSALNSQYGSALNLSGQDEINALEEYIKAVGQLQQQYQNGVTGANDIFGKPDVIIAAKTVLEDAMSDVNRALNNQKDATAALVTAEQQGADAASLWGQVLQEETAKAQTAMDNLKTTIADLSAQIQNMEKTIELTGVDKVSSVVDSISERIKQLHELAKQPITFSSTSGGVFSSNTPVGSDGFTDIPFSNGSITSGGTSDVQNSYADGTDYVPRTGKYMLHQGEAVIPAAENNGGKSVSFGDIIIQIPANAAPQSKDDWRAITRNYIVPELRKLNA